MESLMKPSSQSSSPGRLLRHPTAPALARWAVVGEEQWQEAGLEGGRWGRGGKEGMTQGPSDKLFFDSCTLWARYFSHWTCSHTRGRV